ncbi:MAG: lysophospholipid acyltransferase family protein [Burkholderiaceae bacterium]|jgi:KDO2-lipid IV(A) lauroyltransferase|nr:lysophospholipid acyltransferase family protein [Burkholderiaceae bacterium]
MLTLVRWLSNWPLPWLHAIGGVLGWLTYLASPTYRRRLRENAELAGLGRAQIRAAVAEAGRFVAEVPWLWLGRHAQPISRHVNWDGDALIDEALAAGRGLVLLTPHLGSFEVCAQAYAERWGGARPMTALYRPAKQAWLRTFEEQARSRPGLATAPTTLAGVRQLLRALKRGETVGLLPDQVPPQGQGAWAPFFGRPAYTMTLATRLVQLGGAPWLVMWAERLPRGAGWKLVVRAPQQPLPTAAESDEALQAACARVLNAEMERVIRQCPTQYLWGYNRYKGPRRPDAPAGATVTP